MKKFITLAIALLAFSTADAQLDKIKKAGQKATEKAQDAMSGGGLSQDEAGRGLKEALDAGVGSAVDFLSKKDGYLGSPYKILIPDEAQKVVSKLKNVPGFGNLESDLTERMNRAAEDAASKAKPIFISAIRGMSFKDALNILMGEQDAATQYLNKTTSEPLYKEFMPVIQASLDKVGARELWRSAATAYNKLPLGGGKTNTELDDHVNRKALDGMFSLIAKKELDIRQDPKLRNTDLLRKVFSKQDKK